MNRYYLTVFILICLALGVFITIQYDIFSYHVWAYEAINHSIGEMYNTENYFDRMADYPPLGVYIYVFTGKFISYIQSLSLRSAPLLFTYKLIPLLFLLIAVYLMGQLNKILLAAFIVPFTVLTCMTGHLDIIILILIYAGVHMIEKNDYLPGTFLVIITLFIKQTSFFLCFFILIFYLLNRENRKRFVRAVLFNGIALFLIIFAPFILKGNLPATIINIWRLTTYLSPLSADALNLFSIIPNAQMMDFNYKIVNIISVKSLSIIFLIMSAIFVAVGKRGKTIYPYIALYAIIWFNFMVGLRSQHILYPLFFIIIAAYTNTKLMWQVVVYSLLSLLNIVLFTSMISMTVWRLPVMPEIIKNTLSAVQVLISIYIVIILSRCRSQYKPVKYIGISLKRAYIILMLFLLAVYIVPGRIADSRNFIVDMVKQDKLVDYTHDRYIDISVLSRGPFNNYIGLRISDCAGFTFDASGMKSITFKTGVEYTDSGIIMINEDTISLSTLDKQITYLIKSDTVSIYANVPGNYTQAIMYNAEYEVE